TLGEKKTVDALIDGGKATAGPPLGPTLGPLGVNVLQIVNKINDLTRSYAGMKVPVKVHVDVDDKSFDVEIGTPTTSALIVKELGVEKGSGTPKATKVGNLSLEQIVKLAGMKRPDSYAKTTIAAVKEVAGACVSMGVTVDSKEPKEFIKDSIELPTPTSKTTKVAVIAGGDLAVRAKNAGADLVIGREDLDKLGRDKKQARKLAQNYDFFVAEAPLMPQVGKALGQMLGP